MEMSRFVASRAFPLLRRASVFRVHAHRSIRGWRCLCFVIGIAASSRVAHADGATDVPTVAWSAPAECPDEAYVRARVASLLGRASGAPVDDAVQASGHIEASRKGYKLSLSVKSGAAAGTRELVGEDCRALTDTGAWLVAVTVDPNAPTEPPPAPEAAPTPKAPEPQKPPPPAVAAPVLVPSPWSLHASGAVGVWQSDRPASSTRLQLGGAMGFGYRFLDVEARGSYAFPRTKGTRFGDRLETATQTYALVACAAFTDRIRVGPCAGVSLLVTDAHLRGSQRDDTRAAWAALSLGAQVAWTATKHVEPFLEGGMFVPLSARPRFTERRETVVRAGGIAFYGRLGIRFRWPFSPRFQRP